jgi:hypothetical protein
MASSTCLTTLIDSICPPRHHPRPPRPPHHHLQPPRPHHPRARMRVLLLLACESAARMLRAAAARKHPRAPPALPLSPAQCHASTKRHGWAGCYRQSSESPQ